MSYAEELARKVFARNPKTSAESQQFLLQILEAEGYVDADGEVFTRLRNEVANAARKIVEKSRGKAS